MAPICSFMPQQYYRQALLYRKASLHSTPPALPLHPFILYLSTKKQHHATRPGHANAITKPTVSFPTYNAETITSTSMGYV